jgi:HEAT repeat protein
VRLAAISSLKYFNNINSVAHIGKMLLDENENPLIRMTCAESLYYLNYPETVKILINALTIKNPLIRYNVLIDLIRIHDDSCYNPILSILEKDVSIDCRTVAAGALGTIGNKKAIYALVKVLCDNPKPTEKFKELVWVAKFNLIRLSGQDFGEDVNKWNEWINTNYNKTKLQYHYTTPPPF